MTDRTRSSTDSGTSTSPHVPLAGESRTTGIPGSSDAEEIFPHIRRWRSEGLGVALATVVQTWGSSPRPEGSHLVVNSRGEFAGSVSGGCIEGAVVTEALAALADAKPRSLEFGVSDEQAWEVGLACGGRVRVYVEVIE